MPLVFFMNTYEIWLYLDKANMELLSRIRVLQEAQDKGALGFDEEEKKFSDIQKEVFKVLHKVTDIMFKESANV